MEDQREKKVERRGQKAGFYFSYLLFTVIIFLILTYLGKIPPSWNIYYIGGITLGITLAGSIIKKYLK